MSEAYDHDDDLEAAPAPLPVPTSLGATLNLIRAADEALLLPLDPKQLVTDLRRQVDDLAELDDALKDAEKYHDAKAKEHADKRAKARRNRAGLKGEVAYQMLGSNPDQCIEKIPGNAFYVRLQNNSQPSLEVLREPTEFERDMLPHLVKVIPEQIVWDEDKLRDVLADPEAAERFKDIARLTLGKHARFYPNPRPKLPAKKSRRKTP